MLIQTKKAPAIGFIAHMDTADYNAENIKPRIVENYDGSDICLNEEHQIYTRRADFPNLKNYIGKSLVVTDGLTLLGGDDKAGIYRNHGSPRLPRSSSRNQAR